MEQKREQEQEQDQEQEQEQEREQKRQRKLLEEMITRSCGRRTKAGPLAERLLTDFGTLTGVLRASPAALEQVDGMDEGLIRFIQLIAAILERCHSDAQKRGEILRSPREAIDYLRPYYFSAQREQLYLILLDGENRVKACHHLAQGELYSVQMEFGTVAKLALESGASRVILSHCHISTSEQPSQADLAVTAKLEQILGELGIRLVDHIILADGAEASMAARGLLSRPTEELYSPGG
ncbi:MAG: hypothetical protein LUF28_04870 [Clostridiales bacterium]|nr:hypothetical protein [Clostridiales bacterium]